MVAGVGDGEADFVQHGRPAHILAPHGHFGIGVLARQVHQTHIGQLRHLCGLGFVDMVAVLEFGHGLVAHIVVEVAANHVVKHAVAQGGIGYLHGADAQLGKHANHHG